MTVSRLGFEVDSSQATGAAVDLDKLTQSAERAEKAERGLATSSRSAETATGQFGRSARDASTATAQLERAVDMAAAAQNRQTAATYAGTAAMRAQAGAARIVANNNRQLMFQLVDVGQALATAPTMGIYALQNLGFQVAQIGQMYAGEGGFTAAVRDSAGMVGRFLSRLAPAAGVVAGLTAAVAAYRSEINESSATTVSFGDTALAVWQMTRDGFLRTFAEPIDQVESWFASLWENVEAFARDEFNNIARNMAQLASEVRLGVDLITATFAAGFDAAKLVWSGLPAALGDYVYQTANRVVQGIEDMINGAANRINSLIASLPDWVGLEEIGPIDLGGVSNPFTEQADAFDAGMKRIIEGRSAVFEAARSAHAGRMEGLAGWNPFGDLASNSIANARDRLSEVEDAAGAAGKAMKDAANDNEKPWEEIAKEIQKAKETLGEDWGGALRGLLDGTLEWKDAIIQAGQALLRYLNEANLARGGSGIFGGGLFGSIISGFLGFANGGAFQNGNVVPFANGGIVNRPTMFPMANGAGLMGEAGPEAIMPLRRGPDGRLGVSAVPRMHNPANDPVRIEIVSRFAADGGFESAVERTSRPIARQESVDAAGRVARAVPSMVDARNEEREVRRIRPRSPF